MEFDSEGRIVLPGQIKRELECEQEGIILTKIQISARTPAIAQLKITAGKKVLDTGNFFYEMNRFCDEYSRLNFHDVDKDTTRKDYCILVQSKGSLRMYSFLSGLIGGIKERFSNYPVTIKGSWVCGD